MKKCKSCQTEIDAKATKCPNCKADQRGWFRRHPILSIILVLFVLGIIGTATGGNKTAPSGTIPTTAVENKPTPVEPMKIKVSELADDFDANQVSAKAKWNDKLVEFSATITNITDSGLSFSNVASKQFSMSQISCRITDKQQLMPLKNGQTVTVRGTVGGQMLGVIDLNDCSVVK